MQYNGKDLPTYIKKFVDDSQARLNPFLLQGKLNNEFISGNQYRRINPRNLKIENTIDSNKVYTERKTFNRLLPIFLTRYGILTHNMPIPGIIPYDNTSKAIQDSVNVNKFITTYIQDTNFKTLYQKAIKAGDVYGIEWFKTGIDWTDGDKIADIEANINNKKGTIRLNEGRAFITPVPIHEVFVDSYYIETMEDVNELVHRRVFPVEYIKKRWGYEAEKESINDLKMSMYPRYNGNGTNGNSDIEYAYVYEYYKKPDALYPKGRYVITCNDKVLYDDILPYENGLDGKRMIPFDFFNMQSVPNKLIGITVYSQLISMQETYNAVKNRYLEYINHIAIGQMFVWEGSLVNPNNFTNKPGKIIMMKRNSRPPMPVQKDKVSMEYINYCKSLEEDMLVTAGLSQMSAFGQTKSNVRTDGVVDKLVESDENKLVNALDNISACLISVFKKIIYCEKQRVKTINDILKLAKKDDYVVKYKLEDVDAEQITIVNRDFLMKSDQVFDKKLQQAGNFGLYNPQSGLSYQSKVEFLNAMHASYLTDTLDPMERATHDLCLEEQDAAINGKDIPQAEEFHIHDMHLKEHNLFLISPEVRLLRQKDEKSYKLLMEAMQAHIKQHEQYMAQKSNGNVFANAKEALKNTAKK